MWSTNGDEYVGAGFVKDDSVKVEGRGGSDSKGRRSLMPVNSQKISFITLIGQIGKIETSSAKVDMTIIDSYGPPVDVLFWQGEDRCKDLVSEMFVEVVGTPREVNNGIGMYAFSVNRVTDIAQVMNHNLEVILYGKALERMKQNFMNHNNIDLGFPGYEDPTMATFAGQSTDVYRNSYNAPSQPGSAVKPSNGGPPSKEEVGKKVMAYIVREANEQGSNIKDIQAALKLDAETLKTVMEYLSTEGHVYTTTDDDHYKSTEG